LAPVLLDKFVLLMLESGFVVVLNITSYMAE